MSESTEMFTNPICNMEECEYTYSSTCLGCEKYTSQLVDECTYNDIDDPFVINEETSVQLTDSDTISSMPAIQAYNDDEILDPPAAERMQKAIDGLTEQISHLESRLDAMAGIVKLLGDLTARLNNQPLDNEEYISFTAYE